MKKMDRLENDYLPQIKLDKTDVCSNRSFPIYRLMYVAIDHSLSIDLFV